MASKQSQGLGSSSTHKSILLSKTNGTAHGCKKLGTASVFVFYLDGGRDRAGDDAEAGLVGAEAYRGDACPGVEREIGGHLLRFFLLFTPLRRSGRRRAGHRLELLAYTRAAARRALLWLTVYTIVYT